MNILAKALEAEFKIPIKIINGTNESGLATGAGRGKGSRASILRSSEQPGLRGIAGSTTTPDP